MAFFLPSFIFCSTLVSFLFTTQSYENITIGSSLTAGDDSSSWASLSKDFAFGFQEVRQGNFLLSIWFDKIPEETITWSANEFALVPKGSKVELASDKGLVLAYPSGLEVWSTAGLGDQVSYGAMLDTGNFILASRTSTVIWQSFDQPTDTVLPSQVLNLDVKLISRDSPTDNSSERFMLQLGKDGNLSIYATNDNANSFYLSSSSQGSGYQVQFNQNGSLNLVAKNGSLVAGVFDDYVPGQDYYQRAILEHDGALRHYIYPKNQSSDSGGWSVKSYIPDNICTAVIQQKDGGVCGFNSYCQLGNDSKPHCYCPPGYTSIDPNEPFRGCVQNFTAQSCDDKSDAKHFYFETLVHVHWPMSVAHQSFDNVSEDWCRDTCLSDCYCAISIYASEDGRCWNTDLPLSHGVKYSLIGRTIFVKVRKNNTSIMITNPHHKSRNHKPILVVAIITSLVVCLAVYILRKRKNRKFEDEPKSIGSCFVFSFNTIKAAANDFSNSNKLGKGGFGEVYKGTLPNGWQIAVKRLLHHSIRGNLEFENEVQLMARLHHNNVIRLIGYSMRGQERILIYELAVNGSLDRFLFDEKKHEVLSWEIRYKIVKGIARGMVYLHENSQLRIIHRDLKASNVLLDDSFTPKISDFGTARLFVEDDQGSASKIVGTYGYMPPEYVKHGKISVKVDVFSFGVLLLEILAGKRNSFVTESQQHIDHLPSKAWKYWKEGKHDLVIDPILLNGPKSEIEDIKRCLHIGLLCVQEDDTCRPTMNLVTLMLDGLSLSLPPPLKPAYFMDVDNYQTAASSSFVALSNSVPSLDPISHSIDEPR